MISVNLADAAIVWQECDVMIVDPPYSERVHANPVSNGTGGMGVRKREFGFESCDFHLRRAIARLAGDARRWSLVFSDIESCGAWREALENEELEHVRHVPWVRWSQPQLSGDRPPSGCEMVTIAHPRGKKRWSGPGNLTAFDACCLRGKNKHPAEKPLDLMLSLVSWFSEQGETVLDPCCGAGTTGLACQLLDRNAVLFDNQLRWVEHTSLRLKLELSARGRERCQRWLAAQSWVDSYEPITKAGKARYERARADIETLKGKL